MATVYRQNRVTPTRQYIATAAFTNYFFTYTLTEDPSTFIQSGRFDAVSGASDAKCPKGRILRETGERLFPGQPGVNTLMVKVLDPYTFLSGYIDPNAEVFAVYSTDKPSYMDEGYENNGTALPRHKGPSVYTSGDIIADNGNLAITGKADVSGVFTVGSGVSGAGSLTTLNGALTVQQGGANMYGGLGVSTGNFTVSTGKVYVQASGGGAIIGNVPNLSGTGSYTVGPYRKIGVSTTAVTTNSKVFLNYTTLVSQGVLSAEELIAGQSFVIVSNNVNDASSVNWLIIN